MSIDLPTCVSICISFASLLISLLVAWLTLLQRGNLKMTRPAFIAFLYEDDRPKIFLRTLLYTTGKKGQIIESLFLRVRRNESSQTFSYWAYAEDRNTVVGSGLKVNEEGASYYHHFMPPRATKDFRFAHGTYEIDIFYCLAGQKQARPLGNISLTLSEGQALALERPGAGAFFEWGPESQTYHATIDQRQQLEKDDILKLFLNKVSNVDEQLDRGDSQTNRLEE